MSRSTRSICFHLLTEKLSLRSRSLSLATYNVLFELLTEQICPEVLFVKHEDPPVDQTRFRTPHAEGDSAAASAKAKYGVAELLA